MKKSVSVVISIEDAGPTAIINGKKDTTIIENCLNSVLHQTHKNLEMVIVDGTKKRENHQLLEKFAETHGDFVSVLEGNPNDVWGNRNIGNHATSGDLCFQMGCFDSINPTFLAHLVEVQENTQADIVHTGFQTVSSPFLNSYGESKRYPNGTVFELSKDPTFLYKEPVNIFGYLYPRSFQEEVSFLENRQWGDVAFTSAILSQAKTIAYMTEPGYHFNQGINSTTVRDFFIPNGSILDIFDVCDQMIQNAKTVGTYDMYQEQLEESQVYYACERVQNAGFWFSLSNHDRSELVNALLRLIELKYCSDIEENKGYQAFRQTNLCTKWSLDWIMSHYVTIASQIRRSVMSEETSKQLVKNILKEYQR